MLYSARMNSITVQKCASDGTHVFAYQAHVAERLPNGVRLSARWERPALALGYTTFEPGDHFTEWFYTDRWYNILRICDARDGYLKGWYCNIAAPADIHSQVVTYRDLYLDVWVSPEGRTQVLDEDEFDAAPLDAETRQQARDGLRDLLAEIVGGAVPFNVLHRP
jgi:predicted RNA-binding protein associated with RNAse of E/G family